MKLRHFLIFSTLILFQCTKDKISETDIEPELRLFSNTQLMVADNNSAANIQLYVDGAVQKLSDYTLYVNGEIIQRVGYDFTTSTSGTYTLQAEYNGSKSNSIEITAREDKEYELITVPVIFHIGHFGQSISTEAFNQENPNVARRDIEAALNILNLVFSNELGSEEPNAVDTSLRFKLATKNPDGSLMTSPGIRRYDISEFDIGCFDNLEDSFCEDVAGDEKMGNYESDLFGIATIWNPNSYLNIWIMPTDDGLSRASIQAPLYDNQPLVGVDSHPIGTIIEPSLDGHFPSFEIDFRDLATSTVAHEAGHSLGLYHPFTIAGPDETVCDDFDYCPDTYAYSRVYPDICSETLGYKQSTTVMDYEGLKDCFTYDQRERIRHVLEHGIWHRNWKDSDR